MGTHKQAHGQGVIDGDVIVVGPDVPGKVCD